MTGEIGCDQVETWPQLALGIAEGIGETRPAPSDRLRSVSRLVSEFSSVDGELLVLAASKILRGFRVPMSSPGSPSRREIPEPSRSRRAGSGSSWSAAAVVAAAPRWRVGVLGHGR